MAEVKWIKIDVNVFNNKKIRQIERMPDGDTLLVIWFKLLCLAGSTNDNGLVYITPNVPFDPESLASEMNKPLAAVETALSVFEKFGMIEMMDNIIGLCSWNKYQNTQGLEKIRENGRERVKKYRDKQKQLSHNEVASSSVNTEENQLKTFGKQGLITITDDQLEAMLDVMSLEVFNRYIDKLEQCLLKGYQIHSHYATIMKWYEKDTKV